MILPWKSFKIDLKSFYQFLSTNIPNSDGIIANDSHMEIVEKSTFTQSDIDMIMQYYSSLTEEVESAKINRTTTAQTKVAILKLGMVSKTYDQLTLLERKVLLGLELTESDIDELISL